MTFPRLDDRLIRLAQDRRDMVKQHGIIAQLQMELSETEAYKKLQTAQEMLESISLQAQEADESVRNTALALYSADPDQNKLVCDGVSIAEYTTFEIDKGLAIAWASEHHQKALKLNAAEIKKVAKAGMEVGGVVLGKENRVKIASDLSQYLSSQND